MNEILLSLMPIIVTAGICLLLGFILGFANVGKRKKMMKKKTRMKYKMKKVKTRTTVIFNTMLIISTIVLGIFLFSSFPYFLNRLLYAMGFVYCSYELGRRLK